MIHVQSINEVTCPDPTLSLGKSPCSLLPTPPTPSHAGWHTLGRDWDYWQRRLDTLDLC